VKQCQRHPDNNQLLTLTDAGKAKLLAIPAGESYDKYVGFCWDGVFEAKAICSAWPLIEPDWHFVFAKDQLLTKEWNEDSNKYFPADCLLWEISGLPHTPFLTEFEELEKVLIADCGPIQELRLIHESKTGKWWTEEGSKKPEPAK